MCARDGNWSFFLRQVSMYTPKLLQTLSKEPEIERALELLMELLPLFNSLLQCPASGAHHDGTNSSHYSAPYPFAPALPDKFRALVTEILVGHPDTWTDTAMQELVLPPC